MATLWTPDGEHVVPPKPTETTPADPAPGAASPRSAAATSPEEFVRQQAESMGIDLDSLSPEERAAAEQAVVEMIETRERLASVPAADVIANHAMGLYELAAIHLSKPEPAFAEAALAIDALRAITNSLGDRLGEAAPVLQQAMNQIQMAFVNIKQEAEQGASGA